MDGMDNVNGANSAGNVGGAKNATFTDGENSMDAAGSTNGAGVASGAGAAGGASGTIGAGAASDAHEMTGASLVSDACDMTGLGRANISHSTCSRGVARRLGNSNIEVSPLGMGCMGLTHASGDPLSDADAARVVRAAFDMGYTFFDTAESYTGVRSDGTTAYNEVAVGSALASVRDQVVIATKFGVQHAPDKSLVLDSSPATIRASVEGSLRRLGTDYIDLYYQHRIDPSVEPEEVAGVMADLMAEGKIRAWGISEATEEYLRRAHAVCSVAAVQNRLSCMYRDHLALLPVLDELDMAFVAFSPMANGFLTGSYTSQTAFEGAQDYRSGMPQYTEEGERCGAPLIELLAELAYVHNATPAQVSLAWVLAQSDRVIPIPGSRKPERLQENLDAARVKLTSEELSHINELLGTLDLMVFGGHTTK